MANEEYPKPNEAEKRAEAFERWERDLPLSIDHVAIILMVSRSTLNVDFA